MTKQKHSCTFPNNLKKFRKERGLERAEVADWIGLVRVKQLSLWEKGVILPDSLSLLKLSILYQASPLELYREVMFRLNSYLNERGKNLPTIDF